jgi:hypothetical protein
LTVSQLQRATAGFRAVRALRRGARPPPEHPSDLQNT